MMACGAALFLYIYVLFHLKFFSIFKKQIIFRKFNHKARQKRCIFLMASTVFVCTVLRFVQQIYLCLNKKQEISIAERSIRSYCIYNDNIRHSTDNVGNATYV